MSNRDDYENKLETLKAIPDDEIKTLTHMPVATYIQEADFLYGQCKMDREALENGGVPWELVEDMPVRTNALIAADTIWQQVRHARSENANQWQEQLSRGKRLLKEILQLMQFAFRENPILMKKLGELKKAQTNAAIIQALYNISGLGNEYPSLLTKINFDFSLLNQAVELVEQMSKTLAAVTLERENVHAAKKIRDQAYTHLKEAVDEINSNGQWIFRSDIDKKKRYASNHLRKKRKQQQRKTNPPPESNDK